MTNWTSGNRTLAENRALGASNEEQTKRILERYFGHKLTKTEPFFVLDFHNEDKTFWLEMKRRMVDHDRYDTALVSHHKTNFCTDPNKTYIFAWNYNDGLYYIKYDPETFSKYETGLYACSGGVDYSQTATHHYFVPYTDLKKLTVPMFSS